MNRYILLSLFSFLLLIMLSANVSAGILDPIVDPVRDFLHGLRSNVRSELERTRIGREINRIVEDVEAAGDLVVLASQFTTPQGIASLATQYGHDPDALFNRFQERIDRLRNAHPGGGGGPNGEMTDTEIAAVMQSVLEEPPLPDGVYLGDGCIIDFTSCDFLSPQHSPTYRDSFWGFSCYTEGTVSKKKIGGLNRAACTASWINTYSGETVPVQFLYDNQFVEYYWDDCAAVYLTDSERQSFLDRRGQVCQQPIARHDVGDICAVDYSNCNPGDTTALYNSNRIGTIVYDLIPGTTRRGYLCELPFYGKVALDTTVRRSCERVYVGQREVNEFISSNPEPSTSTPPPQPQQQITPVQQTPLPPPPPPQQAPSLNLEGMELNRVFNTPINTLGDVPDIVVQEAPAEAQVVFGRDGINDITPPSITKRKKETADLLEGFGVQKSFSPNDFRDKIMGFTLPEPLGKIFGSERILFQLRANYGDDQLYCLAIENGVVSGFNECTDSFAGFDATIQVSASQSLVKKIIINRDPDLFFKAVEEGQAGYKGVGLIKKVKLSLASLFLKIFK